MRFSMPSERTEISGRKHVTHLLLDAPIDLVWQVWIEPDHIRHWWGPDGFKSKIEKMEVTPGGDWIFTMHGPDGKVYPNKTIFREVVPMEKLVQEHFAPNFMATIQFEQRGKQTHVTWYKIYESDELYDLIERQYNAAEGFRQTIKRLINYLNECMYNFNRHERP